MKEFSTIGIAGMISGDGHIVVTDNFNSEHVPVMLEMLGTIKEYVFDLSGTDYEEKYMRKRFIYSSYCLIEKIEVLNKDGKVVKTIEQGNDYSNWIE